MHLYLGMIYQERKEYDLAIIEMKKKDKNRLKLLEYLGNPENEFSLRIGYSEILGYKQENQIYYSFTLAELSEIENEALSIRRTAYVRHLAAIDLGMLKEAITNPAAAKLVYQRFENWSEKHQIQQDTQIHVNTGIVRGVKPDAD